MIEGLSTIPYRADMELGQGFVIPVLPRSLSWLTNGASYLSYMQKLCARDRVSMKKNPDDGDAHVSVVRHSSSIFWALDS